MSACKQKSYLKSKMILFNPNILYYLTRNANSRYEELLEILQGQNNRKKYLLEQVAGQR